MVFDDASLNWRSDLKMTGSDAELAKTKNIVEMAFDFTAMTRVFSKGSKKTIVSQVEEHFSRLSEVSTQEAYEDWHRTFCEWFIREIRTAQKKLKNGKFLKSKTASYGHAAKVLDIAIKVYAYYCVQPNPRLAPFLHGAIDTPLLQHLSRSAPSAAFRAKTIKDINDAEYQSLQLLVRAESQRCKVHPVQYDDIMFRRLNRKDNPRTE